MKDLLISLAILLPVYITLFVIMVILLKRINKDFNTIENKDDNPYIEDAGKRGEYYVNKMLEDIAYYNGGYLYKNVHLEDFMGHKAEIDHIYICHSGVYIIETKYWQGTVTGYEGDDYWTQYYGKIIKKNHSPIQQNSYHVYFFRKTFPVIEEVKSMVIMASNNISNIRCKGVYDIESADAYLFNEKRTISDSKVEYYNRLVKKAASVYYLEKKSNDNNKDYELIGSY